MNRERIGRLLHLLAEVAGTLAGLLGASQEVPEERLDKATEGLTTAREALRHGEKAE